MKFMFTKHRKSQAAMEFLMTYGWAILVVLAAIAALAYFGILSPEKFLPQKCLIETGFTCIGHKIEPSQSTLIFSNGLGKTLIVTNVNIAGCNKDFTTTMTSGTDASFVLTGCTNGVLREIFKGEIMIKYTEKATNLTKTAFGDIATKVE